MKTIQKGLKPSHVVLLRLVGQNFSVALFRIAVLIRQVLATQARAQLDLFLSLSSQPSQISSSESTTPFMPNVLKVFLENGQTKSFKYDASTTVGDVLESLHQKLGIKCQEHFSLVVEHVKSLRRNKLTLLDPRETLTRVRSRGHEAPVDQLNPI